MSSETLLGEFQLARIHFVIRTLPEKIPSYDINTIKEQLIPCSTFLGRTTSRCINKENTSLIKGELLVKKYQNAFPAGYREKWDITHALADIAHMEQLSIHNTLLSNLYISQSTQEAQLRFQLFQWGKPIVLSKVLAILENMGLQILDEWPSEIRLSSENYVWIHNFGVKPFRSIDLSHKAIKPLFEAAFSAIWTEKIENDRFNQLILSAGLPWREIVILRAYTKYMHQIGAPFSQAYIESVMARHPQLAQQLIAFFKARFTPDNILNKQETHEIRLI